MQRASTLFHPQRESRDIISFIAFSKNPNQIHKLLKSYHQTSEYRRLQQTKFSEMDAIDAICFVLARHGKDTAKIDLLTLQKLIAKHQTSFLIKIANVLNAILVSLRYSQAKEKLEQQKLTAELTQLLDQPQPSYINFSGLNWKGLDQLRKKQHVVDFSFSDLDPEFIYSSDLTNTILVDVNFDTEFTPSKEQLTAFIPEAVLEDPRNLTAYLDQIKNNISKEMIDFICLHIGHRILESTHHNKGSLFETLFNHSIHGNTDQVGNRCKLYMNIITDNKLANFKRLPQLQDSQELLIPLAKQLFHRAIQSYDSVITFLNSV